MDILSLLDESMYSSYFSVLSIGVISLIKSAFGIVVSISPVSSGLLKYTNQVEISGVYLK